MTPSTCRNVMDGSGMARINSRQVEAFRAMMLTGSVTEAAKLMTGTQPGVSRLLRDFQALLKMELFERRGTGLVPSAAATALYTEVERSFVGLERITAAAEEIRGRRTGTLRIAALPALSNGYLPRLAGHFLKQRPNLNLAFFGVISPIVIDWVLNNQCDIGFTEIPIAHSGLPSLRLPPLPRAALSCVASCRGSISNLPLFSPRSAAPLPWLWISSKPCGTRSTNWMHCSLVRRTRRIWSRPKRHFAIHPGISIRDWGSDER